MKSRKRSGSRRHSRTCSTRCSDLGTAHLWGVTARRCQFGCASLRSCCEPRNMRMTDHEIGVTFDRQEHPAQVVQFEHSETIGLGRDGLLDVPSILVEALFPSGDDFRKNREAIARWSFGKNRSVSPLLYLILEESPFWDRHRRRSGPTSLLRRI